MGKRESAAHPQLSACKRESVETVDGIPVATKCQDDICVNACVGREETRLVARSESRTGSVQSVAACVFGAVQRTSIHKRVRLGKRVGGKGEHKSSVRHAKEHALHHGIFDDVGKKRPENTACSDGGRRGVSPESQREREG